MSYCGCGWGYPNSYYTPLNYYGYAPYPAYPMYGYGYSSPSYGYYSSPSYGLPFGYVYSGAYSPTPYAALGYPRGEHHVGNCLMICQ
ncbi:MAG: hypothetical protein WB661_01405 [Candidatus Bathyarchaeia archaeon]